MLIKEKKKGARKRLTLSLFLVLLMSLLLLVSGCSGQEGLAGQEPEEEAEIVFKSYEDDGTELAIEEPAPPFTLTSLEGKDISLSDYQGKTVLLSFFSTT